MSPTDPQFGGGALEVGFHRAILDLQPRSHFGHGSACQQAQANLLLACGQRDRILRQPAAERLVQRAGFRFLACATVAGLDEALCVMLDQWQQSVRQAFEQRQFAQGKRTQGRQPVEADDPPTVALA